MKEKQLNEIGRLDGDDRKELNELLDTIFAHLDKDKLELAQKKLINISKTPNYFIREYLGKSLTDYSNKTKVKKIIKPMLKHRIYGVRATALFFYYDIDRDKPEKVFKLLQLSAYNYNYNLQLFGCGFTTVVSSLSNSFR